MVYWTSCLPVFSPTLFLYIVRVTRQPGELQAGRWALAVETLEDMEKSDLTPNEHNWLTAIGA